MSGKKVTNVIKSVGEDIQNVKGVFITHEHSDHIQSAGILSRRLNIPLFATEGTWNAMEKNLGKIASQNIRIIEPGYGVEVEGLYVEAFNISHDAAEPVGYKIFGEDKKICIMTDTGYVSDSMEKNLMDSDIILIESNHDEDMLMVGPYALALKLRVLSDRGHLSNFTAGNALAKILHKGNEIVLLGHLSDDNNIPMLAYKTVEEILINSGIEPGRDVSLGIAPRDINTKIFEI